MRTRLFSLLAIVLTGCVSLPTKPIPPAPPPARTGAVGITLTPPLSGVHFRIAGTQCDSADGIAFCVPVATGDQMVTVTNLPEGVTVTGEPHAFVIADQNTEIVIALAMPAPPTPVIPTRTGLVRREGTHAVADAGGLFHPLGATLFWAVWGQQHDRDRMLANAQVLVGYDYVRVLGEVKWDPDPQTGWPGLTLNPCDDDYETALGATIDALYDQFGLRTELTLVGGGTGCDPMVETRKVAAVINAGRAEKIMALEASNEAYDNGPDIPTMIRMVQYLRANTPVALIALSSPFDEDGANALRDAGAAAGATLYTVHTERDGGNFKWRQVRQGYAAASYGAVVDSNEPPGPHSSIDTNDNALQLATMRALGVICGGAMYVFHVGDAVMGRVDPVHNRQPNLSDVPNLPALLKAVRGVDALLPAGVENWTRTTQHGGTDRVGTPQPLLADAIWSDGADHGVDRAYGAVGGNAWVEVLTGVKDHVTLSPLRALHADAYDPETGELKASIDLADGQTWTLPGRADTMTAYIVRGTFN